jgi:hypothetical protein
MPNVTLRSGPHGIATAFVDPPYEFLGEFLTVEGSSLDGWVFTNLYVAAQSIHNGSEAEFFQAGDAHSVHIRDRSVTVISSYRTHRQNAQYRWRIT